MRYNINIDKIVSLNKKNSISRKINIKKYISWKLNNINNIQYIHWGSSSLEHYIHENKNSILKKVIIVNLTNQTSNHILKLKFNNNFITSTNTARLTRNVIRTVIKRFKSKLNIKNFKKKDKFRAIISKKTPNGKNKTNKPNIIYSHIKNKDCFKLQTKNSKLYKSNTNTLKNYCIYFPIENKFRISSNFDPKRINPITERISPHLGVDFAVPIGTPVLAVSDGKVIVSKRSDTAGNYVVICHDNQYITRYMHLKKFLVKKGQKVRKGECLALSGNTGRSTGPHLHYEIWINKKPVDPLKTKLPQKNFNKQKT